ncbi:MAG: OmpA family protein [Flavobacteriales bacterium]|nr:OmpA family protein [Flavobacteriales bacterium]
MPRRRINAPTLISFKTGLVLFFAISMIFSSCKSMNKTQKGAVIGTAAGGAMGAVIGKASGNTALGAIIGATVGGASGAIIGNQMDKQAKEIEASVPGVAVERVGEGIVVEFSNKILFGFDQSILSDAAKENLTKLVTVLNEYPETDIEIQGHTDSDGSKSYNQNLSEERAIAVSNTLISKGINANRITVIGFGEGVPKYENETEAGRATNRRVEFIITANEKMKAEAEKEASK